MGAAASTNTVPGAALTSVSPAKQIQRLQSGSAKKTVANVVTLAAKLEVRRIEAARRQLAADEATAAVEAQKKKAKGKRKK